MSLSLSLFNPHQGLYSYVPCAELNGQDAVGFEDYRGRLWGSPTMKARGYRFLPVLANADLFVFPADMPTFQRECENVWENARSIASDIWPDGILEKWCPIRRAARIRERRVRGARSIRAYMRRTLRAIELAQSRGLGVSIS